MKIEFVKETKWDGTTYYFTQVDGKYVSDTLKANEEAARKLYDKVLSINGITPPVIEIIETVDTEMAEPKSISYEEAAAFDEENTNAAHENQNSSTLAAQPFKELP